MKENVMTVIAQNMKPLVLYSFTTCLIIELPEAIFQNEDELFAWAKESMAIAHASKKKS